MKYHMLFLFFVLASAPVFAQNTPQQEKMKACNADAAKKELKGDQRQAFMKECLAGKSEAKAEKKAISPQQQQEKMKKCNADAGAMNLKGDERKKYMSGCLKSQ